MQSIRVSNMLQAPGRPLTAAEDSDSDVEGDDLGDGSAMGGMYNAEEMEVSLEDEEALAAFMVSCVKDKGCGKAVAACIYCHLLKARLQGVPGQGKCADVTGAEALDSWPWHTSDDLRQVQVLKPCVASSCEG